MHGFVGSEECDVGSVELGAVVVWVFACVAGGVGRVSDDDLLGEGAVSSDPKDQVDQVVA